MTAKYRQTWQSTAMEKTRRVTGETPVSTCPYLSIMKLSVHIDLSLCDVTS